MCTFPSTLYSSCVIVIVQRWGYCHTATVSQYRRAQFTPAKDVIYIEASTWLQILVTCIMLCLPLSWQRLQLQPHHIFSLITSSVLFINNQIIIIIIYNNKKFKREMTPLISDKAIRRGWTVFD